MADNSPPLTGRWGDWLSTAATAARVCDAMWRPAAGKSVDRAWALHRLCREVCALHGVAITQVGAFPQEPAIYVANHHGYVDPIAICGRIPCAPLARYDVADWPLVGTTAQKFDVIFVRRDSAFSGASALLRARTLLREGVSILNFPEGTTTDGCVLPFKPGVFGLAALLAIPVVPLAVRLSSSALFWVRDETLLGHYGKHLLGGGHSLELVVGPRMFCAPTERAEEFAARVRAWVVSAQRDAAPLLPRVPAPAFALAAQ